MDNIINELAKYLSFTQMRHKILASNIANADTPHYKAFDLRFKDIFKKSNMVRRINMVLTNSRHIRPAYLMQETPKLIVTPPLTVSQDGNWVDLEYQMAQLAENTMEYEIATQLLAKKFEEIKFAISEGR